jgi:hypothetical protein
MKDHSRRWTIEEAKIVCEQVEKNPNHIRESFYNASLLINRTEAAICNRYYNYIMIDDNLKENSTNSEIQSSKIKDSQTIFQEKQSAMSNKELIDLVQKEITFLCRSGGRRFTMTVPPMITDSDMILSELVKRFKEKCNDK